MIVVADAGPLIHLGAIGRLEFISAVGDILVPPAVYDEVVVMGAGLPGAREVADASWLTVVCERAAYVIRLRAAEVIRLRAAEVIRLRAAAVIRLRAAELIALRAAELIHG